MRRNFPCSRAVTLAALVWSSLGFSAEIHQAAARGDIERVEALLQNDPALVSSRTVNGWTPLHFAVASAQNNVAAVLLINRADVNAKDNMGWTPFHKFDPFPFGLLTLIVSLEAIFLSTFVLISQNRQAARNSAISNLRCRFVSWSR